MLDKKEQGIILLLWSAKDPHTKADTLKDNFFPSYLKYDYEINDPQEVYSFLLNQGLLSRASVLKVIPSLSVVRLKEILTKYGLSKKGTKEDLIDRIFEGVTEDQLASEITEQYYSLSEIGRELLDENFPLIALHQNPTWDTSYEKYMEERNLLSEDFSFRDVMWSIFNKRIETCMKRYDWWGMRFTYFNLGDIALRFDHDEMVAVSFWLTSFMFDMNHALSHKWNVESISKDPYELYRSYTQIRIYIPPYLIAKLRKHRNIIPKISFESIVKPPSYDLVFTEDEYKYIIEALAGDKEFDVEKWDYFCNEKNTFWVFDSLRKLMKDFI